MKIIEEEVKNSFGEWHKDSSYSFSVEANSYNPAHKKVHPNIRLELNYYVVKFNFFVSNTSAVPLKILWTESEKLGAASE